MIEDDQAYFKALPEELFAQSDVNDELEALKKYLRGEKEDYKAYLKAFPEVSSVHNELVLGDEFEVFQKAVPGEEDDESDFKAIVKVLAKEEAAKKEAANKQAARKEVAKKEAIDKEEKRNLEKRISSELSLYNICLEQVENKYPNLDTSISHKIALTLYTSYRDKQHLKYKT